ncbi:phosphoserine phosphatase SerB [Chelatococcus reniformis]|uniref:Phosphoserine phosphatase n=1 Tax=Chelatococcus reniformis TaxID=1494448 RepID=A0A916XQ09_9HYPH|nr:phosphoserine phosphatase SerB [Chelatococcus reniformis]GGC90980.1 phosphoserine phosphatase SerB [Chelatococcus reniformis]
MTQTPTPSVATLVASPAATLPPPLVADIGAAIGASAPVALAAGRAVDLNFASGEPAATIADRVRAMLTAAASPVDVIVQPAAGRRKRLFLADMDSTMIGQECIDELADFVGLKAEVSAITERAMRGELAFEPALRERVSLLKGLPLAVVDTIIAERLTLTAGGRTLVMTMRRHGAYTCLVSGGFTVFTGPIGGKVGFDEHRSNTLLLDGERLAGRVAEPILGRQAKLATLTELRDRFGLGQADTMAVGDGANDLAMLQEAGLGVAFHAKPAVAAAAHARIDHGDLTALLFAQGYREDEWVR